MALSGPHKRLRNKLNQGIHNYEAENSRRLFARFGLEQDIFTETALEQLFEHTSIPNKRAPICAQRTIKDREGKSRLKVLAIILLRPHCLNFDHFVHWADRESKDDSGGKRFPDDSDLPLSFERARDVFKDASSAREFVDDQGIFLTHKYEQGKPLYIDKDKSQHLRHPIIGDPITLGTGASGRVQKITIAPGHFIFAEHNSKNEENLDLAQKVFDTNISDKTFLYFEMERKISERLGDSVVTHKHLIRNFGSFVIKDTDGRITKCRVFYELAKGNLQEFLLQDQPEWPFQRDDLEGRCEIMNQLASLVSAVYHLHQNDIYHLDLKLNNILVVVRSEPREPRAYLAVADYNLSVIRDQPQSSEEASSTSGVRPEGAYQPPEVLLQGYAQSRVGWWTDLWSLGCIVFVVLVYIYEGPSGVKKFQELRRRYWGLRREAFWIQDGDKYRLSYAVELYSRKVRYKARKESTEEAEIIDELLSLLEHSVLIPDEKRRRDQGRDIFDKGMKQIIKAFDALVKLRKPPQGDDGSSGRKPSTDSQNTSVTRKRSDAQQIYIAHAALCEAINDGLTSGPSNVETLLREGNSPTEYCSLCQQTPLHTVVVFSGRKYGEQLLDLLLHDDFDPDLLCKDFVGRTPLIKALERGDYLSTKLLINCHKKRDVDVEWDKVMAHYRWTKYSRELKVFLTEQKRKEESGNGWARERRRTFLRLIPRNTTN